jgi:FtsP/CotA-like multicopper oxidase with cupredoxin domain
VDLATVEVTGPPAPALPALPRFPEPRDLRGTEPVARRRLLFSMGMGGGAGGGGMGGMRFLIDGREFDPDRVDQEVTLGSVEEWTIANSSPMDHPLHLHVWPMQVVARDGTAVDEVTWQDVVNVPAGGEVTVRVAFETFPGRTVYHCHILDHEDLGMMGVVRAG